jgi:glycosyltransferase involved in cell wall biosynthesis
MGFTPDPRPVVEGASRDYVAFLGRMDFHQKGLDLLLDAIKSMELPVRFAGAGPEVNRLQAALRNLSGSEFLGKLHGPEKWDFLRGARFVVIPSRFEGQPIVAIEAAAAGTPILASPIPELAFVQEEGIGRSFPKLDSQTLRTGLLEMWEATSDSALYQEAMRKFASTRDWNHIGEQFEAALLATAGVQEGRQIAA